MRQAQPLDPTRATPICCFGATKHEQGFMEEFGVGDVVTMKSGGPSMTVVSVAEDGGVVCQWFLKSGRLEVNAFLPATITKKSSSATLNIIFSGDEKDL